MRVEVRRTADPLLKCGQPFAGFENHRNNQPAWLKPGTFNPRSSMDFLTLINFTFRQVRGVSHADAALKAATRLATDGGIALGETATVYVNNAQGQARTIRVTPTGQSFRPSQVAAA
jgi:hypothetical protein